MVHNLFPASPLRVCHVLTSGNGDVVIAVTIDLHVLAFDLDNAEV